MRITKTMMRATLLRVSVCEALRGQREATPDEIANGQPTIPKRVYLELYKRGLIRVAPALLTDAGRAELAKLTGGEP